MASRVERVKGVKQVRAIRARAIISVGGRLAKRDSGGGEAAVGEAAVDLREAGVSREELSIARHEGDARTRIKDAISSSSNRPLVGKPTSGLRDTRVCGIPVVTSQAAFCGLTYTLKL